MVDEELNFSIIKLKQNIKKIEELDLAFLKEILNVYNKHFMKKTFFFKKINEIDFNDLNDLKMDLEKVLKNNRNYFETSLNELKIKLENLKNNQFDKIKEFHIELEKIISIIDEIKKIIDDIYTFTELRFESKDKNEMKLVKSTISQEISRLKTNYNELNQILEVIIEIKKPLEIEKIPKPLIFNSKKAVNPFRMTGKTLDDIGIASIIKVLNGFGMKIRKGKEHNLVIYFEPGKSSPLGPSTNFEYHLQSKITKYTGWEAQEIIKLVKNT